MISERINFQLSNVAWWHSIRFNLIITLLVVALIPVIAITLVISNGFRNQMIQQVTAQLDSVATLKASAINTWIDTAKSELEILAQNPLSKSGISSVLSNADQVEQRINFVNQALILSARESQVAKSIFAYDFEGKVKLASNPADLGKVVTRQPFFNPSFQTDEFYVQPPFYDIATAELTLIATRPVYNDINEPVGIIAARLNTETLSRIMLERSGLGDSGETYLVSLQNNYFLTPSRFEGYVQNRAYTSFGIEQALQQIEGAGLYEDYRDPAVPVVGVYRWIPELESAMLVEIDEAEALSAFNQALLSGTQALIAVALIVVVVGVFISGRIARPIQWLSEAAQSIARGDLERRVTVKGHDEISLLATSFNQMTEKLSTNIQELDKNIHETEEANKELARQTALAREATRLKSEFLATMSHELRTPLNAINGFTGIMLFDEDIMDEDNVHMLRRIEANADRLLTLINDVLDLSKIEAGRVEIIDEPVNVPTLVEQWIGETAVLAENKQLPLEVDVVDNFPTSIYGDPTRLAQIAKNLLSNAIKFTSDGHVKLSVSIIDNYWQIDVEDTGIGIPPHAKNYIFDEFRQVDGSTKRVYGGTGLGLAITRNLVLMMDGTISVESELGQGSTFTVRLPLRPANMPEAILAN